VFRGANGHWPPRPIATTTGTSHTSYSLENGTTYSFTVAAYTQAGNGPLSLAVSATPLAPPARINVAARNARVTLTWPRSTGASSYTVYRRAGRQVAFSEVATGVVSPTFVDASLKNGMRYDYQIRAVSGATQSELSAKVSAVPMPQPPLRAVLLTAVGGNAVVTLRWHGLPDATSYKIYRSTNGVFDGPAIATTTGTTFTNVGLTNGTTYFYTVAGRNMGGGEGPHASPIQVTPAQ
jgi:cellulose 1,4-beta-cellobiosidase